MLHQKAKGVFVSQDMGWEAIKLEVENKSTEECLKPELIWPTLKRIRNQGYAPHCFGFAGFTLLESVYSLNFSRLLTKIPNILEDGYFEIMCTAGSITSTKTFIDSFFNEKQWMKIPESVEPIQDQNLKVVMNREVSFNARTIRGPFDATRIQKYVTIFGPLAMSFKVEKNTQLTAPNGKEGPAYDATKTYTQHVMTVTGWNTINGNKCFVIKNSHGKRFGDNGFLYLPFSDVDAGRSMLPIIDFTFVEIMSRKNAHAKDQHVKVVYGEHGF